MGGGRIPYLALGLGSLRESMNAGFEVLFWSFDYQVLALRGCCLRNG